MIEVDQFAKSIKLSFDCPCCGKHIGYPIEDFPQPDMSAENYSDSVNSDFVQFQCFSCNKETFNVEMSAGQGDKHLSISNPSSKYPINEENVEIIVTSEI